MAPLLQGVEPRDICQYARGVVYFQSAMLSALLDSFFMSCRGGVGHVGVGWVVGGGSCRGGVGHAE